ncbi:MAG: hypothetical protein LAT76_03360 [Schleiferiaceae bacterium]|nr:hypothetical protein [Schleiferiaceae bacterium]
MNFYSTILNQLEAAPADYKSNYVNRVNRIRQTLRKTNDLNRTAYVGAISKNPYKCLPFLLGAIAEGQIPVVFTSARAAKKFKHVLPIKHGYIHSPFPNPLEFTAYQQIGWKKITAEKNLTTEINQIPRATLVDQPCIVIVFEDAFGNLSPSGWTHNELSQLFIALKKHPYDFFQFLLTNANLTPSNLWLKYQHQLQDALPRFKFFNNWSNVSKWSVLSV